MKTPSNYLHFLVHSLTKSEKRYLRLYATGHEKDYLALLDALLKQEIYEEEQLKVKYKGARFLRNLAMSKQFLTEYILKMLDRFRKENEANKLLSKGRTAQILLSKGLVKKGRKRLEKALQKAEKSELFEVQLQLLETLKKFPNNDFERIVNTINTCLKKLKNINAYWQISQQIHALQLTFRQASKAEKETALVAIYEQKLVQQYDLALTFRSRVYFRHARATYYFLTQQKTAAYTENQAFLTLLESHPQHLAAMPERYLTTLNNFLIDSLVLGKYEGLETGLKKLRALEFQTGFKQLKGIQARIFRQALQLEFNYLLATKRYTESTHLTEHLHGKLNQYGDEISAPHRLTFTYLAAYFLLLNQSPSKALDWINNLLHEQSKGELFQFALILNLLAHFDLKNYDLLENLLPSTRRRLRQQRDLYATEVELFRFLKKLLDIPNRKEKRQLFDAFESQLIDLQKQPKEQRFFNFIDLFYWLDHQ